MARIEKVQLHELSTGDQIAVMGYVADLDEALVPLMSHAGGKYFHHGIFDKERLEVIELHGDTKDDAKPKRRPILDFVSGRPLYRVVHETCLPVETTMEMANEVVANQSYFPSYHLIKNNCETFATYLKTGIPYSQQASDAIKQFLRSAVLVMSAVAASSIAVLGRR